MSADLSPPAGLYSDLERHMFASQFLGREAKLLDERRFDEWILMIDDQIVYEVPLRQGRVDYADEFPKGAFRLRDDMAILKLRLERLKSGYAWSETPPSRTMRMVGSILVETTDAPDVIAVDSTLLLYRQRGNAEAGDIVPVRRSDTIRITPSGGALLSRRAVIPDTVLQTPNLGIIL